MTEELPATRPQVAEKGSKLRNAVRRVRQMSLTTRMFLLVVIAVLPAIGTQAYNEYDLRRSRAEDIRQQVVQITKQFGEEMGERQPLGLHVPLAHEPADRCSPHSPFNSPADAGFYIAAATGR
jgi:hypothetical protein